MNLFLIFIFQKLPGLNVTCIRVITQFTCHPTEILVPYLIKLCESLTSFSFSGFSYDLFICVCEILYLCFVVSDSSICSTENQVKNEF